MLPFVGRFAAGQLLGQCLTHHAGSAAIVFGVAHGGFAVATGVAELLGAPLDITFARKLFATDIPELVIGAVAEGGCVVLDGDAVARTELSSPEILQLAHVLARTIALDAHHYRHGQPQLDVRGCTAIVIDDGIVGTSMLRAAATAAKKRGAMKVVVAAPLGAERAIFELSREVDEVVCLATPPRLRRVSAWYEDSRHR